MASKKLDFSGLAEEDTAFVRAALRGRLRDPDLTIGEPAYLHRWHLVPRNKKANVYLHIQVASDPDRPLHDHPWDNTSVIVSGGYDELIMDLPWPGGYVKTIKRKSGAVVHRQAEQPHRLILPAGTPYTITIFSTGPVVRSWGFWCDVKSRITWIDHESCIGQDTNGHSVWTGPKF